MPRALLVSQPTTEGVAVCVAALARAATEAGWDVTVASPAGGDLAGWVADAGAAWTEVAMTREPSLHDLVAIRAVRAAMGDADVVHLHSSKAGAVGRAALATRPRARRPVSLFTPHAWSWMVGGKLEPVYRVVERGLAGMVDAIVAVSDEERAEGVAVLPRAAAERIVVIPNGVDVDRLGPTGAVAERPGTGPLLVCVGRLARQKGQDVAVRALARLGGTVRLRLVGAGPEEDALRALAASCGVAERVEFAGLSDDPAAHFRAADVVVVPSRWDGLSLSLLEAMACGRPIVASRVPGSAALDGAGLLVEPDDPGALADGLRALLDDGPERERLGAAARARAVERFDARQRVADVVHLWDDLLARRSASGSRGRR